MPLYIPENGFIGINVPLTPGSRRKPQYPDDPSSLHRELSECAKRLGITNPIVNPFRIMTKGEILRLW